MNISRIVLALLLIIGAGGAVAGGTAAFFSDTETSVGNSFTAGAIDLLIDNDSYYNGNRCVNVGTSAPDWRWQGPSAFPEPGTPCTTSFGASNLDGLLFFNFTDLKPDDEGEDTISIHVQNDAWACMDLTLTSNDDISSVDPELGDGDLQDIPGNAWDGELAQNLDFFWWADDGDNVYEEGERPLTKSGGVQSLYDLATSTGSFKITLADSGGNAWGGTTPLPANQTVYVAKGWCMGDMTLNPLTQDNLASDGPQLPNRVGTGFTCDGTLLDNTTQTDGVEVSIVFSAIQARNNAQFRCNPPGERTGTLTVNKALLVSTAGIEVADFTLHIVGPGGDQVVSDEVPVPGLQTGSYTVYEQVTGTVGGKDFITTFSGVCSTAGDVTTSDPFTLNPNDNVTCTILNDEIGDFAPPTNN